MSDTSNKPDLKVVHIQNSGEKLVNDLKAAMDVMPMIATMYKGLYTAMIAEGMDELSSHKFATSYLIGISSGGKG